MPMTLCTILLQSPQNGSQIPEIHSVAKQSENESSLTRTVRDDEENAVSLTKTVSENADAENGWSKNE